MPLPPQPPKLTAHLATIPQTKMIPSASEPLSPPLSCVSLEQASGTPVRISTRRGAFQFRFYGPTDLHLQTANQPLTDYPLLITIHGAGMSSMSFGICAATLAKSTQTDNHPCRFRVASLDLRCHGSSTFEQGEGALTMDTLVEDTSLAISTLLEEHYPSQQRFYLAGHSLGGSVATFAAQHKRIASKVAGVVLLDIAEGVAKGSLRHMREVLDRRPKEFQSTTEAAHWFVSHGGMGSLSAALLSVPFLLKQRPEENNIDSVVFEWATDLYATEPCWDTWFEGLDKHFIQLPCPKMLMLANTDRLDKELMVGQMQGKFQLEVVGSPGHYVMEDAPDIVAGKLARFVYRVDSLSSKLPQFTAHTLGK